MKLCFVVIFFESFPKCNKSNINYLYFLIRTSALQLMTSIWDQWGWRMLSLRIQKSSSGKIQDCLHYYLESGHQEEKVSSSPTVTGDTHPMWWNIYLEVSFKTFLLLFHNSLLPVLHNTSLATTKNETFLSICLQMHLLPCLYYVVMFSTFHNLLTH